MPVRTVFLARLFGLYCIIMAAAMLPQAEAFAPIVHAFVADAPNLRQNQKNPVLKRFVVAFVAFVGLIVPATFTMAVLAAPPARQDAPHLPGCDRNLADASAGVAAMQARIKGLSAADADALVSKAHEICPYSNATRNNISVTVSAVVA